MNPVEMLIVAAARQLWLDDEGRRRWLTFDTMIALARVIAETNGK